MNLTQLIDFIWDEYPEIMDANSCARWILGEHHAGKTVGDLCSYWSEHQHD